MIDWITLDSLEQLENIQEKSFDTPQVIFKHSTTCPISHMAKNRVESAWNIEGVHTHHLDLKRHRQVSDAIASKWHVDHESPQLILIKDGKAIYNESHLDISVNAVEKSLEATHA